MKDEKKEQREECCADCGYHTNHPSYCHRHGKYVGRKNKPCDDMKRRKK
jgi:hypothetical protein